MIEIIPNEKKQTLVDKVANQITLDEWKLPRNFRQIGNPDGRARIYIEDYVYTYLHQHGDLADEHRLCILAGKIIKNTDAAIWYISGAFELHGVSYSQNIPILTEEHRNEICAEIKRYFDGQVLLGWYLDAKGITPTLTPELERLHKRFFGGRDKVLIIEDSLEKEEAVYADEHAAIRRHGGYYVYYEKNEAMQEYMITSRLNDTVRESEPEKVADEALKNYRELVIRKEAEKSHRWRGLLYVSSFLIVFSFCLIGISMMNNYEQMQKLEGAITSLAGNQERARLTASDQMVMNIDTEYDTEYKAEQNAQHDTSVVVETIGSNLEPLEAAAESQNTEATVETAAETVANEADTSGNAVEATETTQQEETTTEPPATEATAVLTESETIRLQGYYIVEKGENLAQISQKIYGTTDMMSAIIEKNAIEDSDKIFAGEKLLLPQ